MRQFEGAGARSESVRQANLAAVLRTLHLGGPVTRSELVAATGLTRSAIGALVGELAELGFVDEHPSASDGSPGRPSPIVRPRPGNVVLALEVLVDSIAVAAVGLGGDVSALERRDRPRADMPPDRTVPDLVEMATAAMAELGAGTRLFGVGVAVAGVVRDHSTVVFAPNVGWHDVPFADMLTAALGWDVPVACGNDADMGALAESRRGAAAGRDDVVYVSGEVGVGGGIIAGGRPLDGTTGSAGEIGHMPVVPDGRPCKCGSWGCWETEVGEEALLRRSGRRPDGGRPELDELLDQAAAGDADVLAAMTEHGRWLGYGLAGVVNVFDPELVVLGGMFARVHPYVAEALTHELAARVFGEVRADTQVVPAGLGVDAPLVGAAEWVWDRVVGDPQAARPATLR
ncbi:MAG TPA: ROK family transcriptional regulator [Ilumatobacter sp.]|nr:ROK family transcriptional regulator [Ilumatobacter sp.]